MTPSEQKAIQIWIALVEQYPAKTMFVLRKIRDDTAYFPAPSSQLKFTAGDVFDGEMLIDYLDRAEGGPKVSDLRPLVENNPTKKTLLHRLERLLGDECSPEEARSLYRIMDGDVLQTEQQKESPVRSYSTERYGEHIWRALMTVDWSRALHLMGTIHDGVAYFKAPPGSTQQFPFHRSDLLDGAKLESFLSGLSDPIDVDELVKRVPCGEAGDFHRKFRQFIYQHCGTKEQEERLYEMFFNEPLPVEVDVAKKAIDYSGHVEPIPTALSKTYADFLACGQQLGIPITTLSIILPSETRKKLMMEVLSELTHGTRDVTP